MARNITLEDLRLQSRQRADKVNSGYILDSELNSYINSSTAELYDLLVGAYGDDYYSAKYSFSTLPINSDGTTPTYDLPSDFYKLIGIDMYINPLRYITLKPYMFNERGRYQDGSNWAAIVAIQGPRYHLMNNQLEFNPPAPGQYNMLMYYVPECPLLINDSDVFDGVNGWEEYIIVDAAIKMLQKEESDVSVLLEQKNKLIKRINLMAENRDIGHSFVVNDVTRDWEAMSGDVYRY